MTFKIVNFLLIICGIYGLCTQKNIIKTILCLNIVQSSVILWFLSVGYNKTINLNNRQIVISDPLPQALVITTIIIGVAITGLTVALASKIQEKYNTLNWREIQEDDDVE